ncbi:HAD-IIA family hydrolase [Rummeliibacillus sp. NPDC094406]|uniref:HAD-IIA family hydrolase n=1 Tax=Rummeliibacillus sp. NPDC094406 TaxID=3364511 RepID=UPI0037FDFBBA
MVNIDDFDAYCFDLDGTIYVGDVILPGVKETIDRLRRHDKKVLFITNTSIQTREECLQRLQKIGVNADLDEIITASFISAVYFFEQFPNSQVYIVGEKAIKNEFSRFSLKVTENPMEATHVVVGLDFSFTYEKLNLAMNAVRNGAKLVVTNPDPCYPVPKGHVSDTLAIAKAIEVASGQSIDIIVGKPSSFYGCKMIERLKTENNRCLIIGDRLETDIMLGKTNNFRTCLVLTGVANKKDVVKTKIYPDYIVENLHSLLWA